MRLARTRAMGACLMVHAFGVKVSTEIQESELDLYGHMHPRKRTSASAHVKTWRTTTRYQPNIISVVFLMLLALDVGQD